MKRKLRRKLGVRGATWRGTKRNDIFYSCFSTVAENEIEYREFFACVYVCMSRVRADE